MKMLSELLSVFVGMMAIFGIVIWHYTEDTSTVFTVIRWVSFSVSIMMIGFLSFTSDMGSYFVEKEDKKEEPKRDDRFTLDDIQRFMDNKNKPMNVESISFELNGGGKYGNR